MNFCCPTICHIRIENNKPVYFSQIKALLKPVVYWKCNISLAWWGRYVLNFFFQNLNVNFEMVTIFFRLQLCWFDTINLATTILFELGPILFSKGLNLKLERKKEEIREHIPQISLKSMIKGDFLATYTLSTLLIITEYRMPQCQHPLRFQNCFIDTRPHQNLQGWNFG